MRLVEDEESAVLLLRSAFDYSGAPAAMQALENGPDAIA
jgi:hypothetical protein